jgi:copper chaperone CopZ
MTPREKLTIEVIGMDCPDCVATIENAVMRLPGVIYVGVSLGGGTMTIRPGPVIDVEQVISEVVALGYAIGGAADAIGTPPAACPCRSRNWRH